MTLHQCQRCHWRGNDPAIALVSLPEHPAKHLVSLAVCPTCYAVSNTLQRFNNDVTVDDFSTEIQPK